MQSHHQQAQQHQQQHQPHVLPNQLGVDPTAALAVAAAAQAGMQGYLNPYMLPYPYGYPIMPEQQAGLAELLIQQQRLNAVAAQLMGMPAAMPGAPQLSYQAGQQHPSVLAAMHQQLQPQHQNVLVPSIFPHGSYGQQMKNPYQAAQPSHLGPSPMSNHPDYSKSPSVMATQQHQPSTNGGLYPSLHDLGGVENKPVVNHLQHPNAHRYDSAAPSSAGASPASSSSYYHQHSTSPMPQHARYMNGNGQPQYLGNEYQQSQQQQQTHRLSPHSQSASVMSSSSNYQQQSSASPAERTGSVLGKTKRSFTEEADALLNELKKKRFDSSDPAPCEF